MLRRMNEKGYVSCEERDGMKSYAPLIPREKAVLKETENFISRVYHGSVGMMMNAIARQKKLTQAEIEELYAILDEAKGETK
jgi:BlaI family penicillinase repressor